MVSLVSGLRRAYEEKILNGYDSADDDAFDPELVSSDSGSDSEDDALTLTKTEAKNRYNFRSKGSDNLTHVALEALNCRNRIDSDNDESTPADLVLNPMVATPPSRFTRGLALLALTVTAVAGAYLGKKLFSENTAPVKELCDAKTSLLVQNFGFQLSEDKKIVDDAVQALDSAFTCSPKTEAVQGLVKALNITENPLTGIFDIFKEAARNISNLVTKN